MGLHPKGEAAFLLLSVSIRVHPWFPPLHLLDLGSYRPVEMLSEKSVVAWRVGKASREALVTRLISKPAVVADFVEGGEGRRPVDWAWLLDQVVPILDMHGADAFPAKQFHAGDCFGAVAIRRHIVQVVVNAHRRVIDQVHEFAVIRRAE